MTKYPSASKQQHQQPLSLSTATTHNLSSSSRRHHNGGSHNNSISLSNKNALLLGRVLYIACLLGVAALLGYFAYSLVDASQQNLAETQFESIAERALKSVERIASRKQSGTKTMAKVVAQAIPDATAYPFVTVPGFESMATSVLETSASREMGFLPIVEEDQLEEFETFAYEYFERRFPDKNDTAVSSFGRGVWATNAQGERYHDTSGATDPTVSNGTYLTPILQHDRGPHPVLMLNVRGEIERARQMEDMMKCADDRRQSTDDSLPCGAITDIVTLRGQPPGTGPGAVVIEPIYPANEPYQITAILASTIVWDEILEDVFAATVSGIDCVFETNTGTVYSYQIQQGIAKPIDWKDLHDPKYDRFQRSIQINNDKYTRNSPQYTLHLYPNDEFYLIYNTFDPLYATLMVVGVMLFTGASFLTYDCFVRREFASKKELLEARRRFVRFISHEVRTPLNSVCMGLSLMQEKKAKKAGYERAELLTKELEKEEQQQQQQQQSTYATSRKTPSKQLDPETLEEFSLVTDLLCNAQSSVDVLNDFLNFDKIESGKLKLDLHLVNIRALIESITKEFRLSATKKQLDYDLVFDEERRHNHTDIDVEAGVQQSSTTTALVGDQVRIKQVLRNLISNAIKFTNGGGKVEIRVTYVPPPDKQRQDQFELKDGEVCDFVFGGYIQVQVEDTGAGLSGHQLAKLFSEHIQFNPNDLQAGKGSGLGLFISKGIVEQHGGTLVASSEGLNQGSTFTMTLPIYQADLSAADDDAGGETAAETSDSSHQHMESNILERSNKWAPASHRILIVDDALSNRKMMNRLLNHHGHTCEMAENGQIAVSMVAEATAKGEPYDTILLDYEMPVMNGPDAAERIRESGNDTFIVGVTGNMFPEDTERFLTSGANAVLPKPFKMNALDTLWAEYFQNEGD